MSNSRLLELYLHAAIGRGSQHKCQRRPLASVAFRTKRCNLSDGDDLRFCSLTSGDVAHGTADLLPITGMNLL